MTNVETFYVLPFPLVKGAFPSQGASNVDFWFFYAVDLDKILKNGIAGDLPWRSCDVTAMSSTIQNLEPLKTVHNLKQQLCCDVE